MDYEWHNGVEDKRQKPSIPVCMPLLVPSRTGHLEPGFDTMIQVAVARPYP